MTITHTGTNAKGEAVKQHERVQQAVGSRALPLTEMVWSGRNGGRTRESTLCKVALYH